MDETGTIRAAEGAAAALELTVDALAAELRQANERLRQEVELRKRSERALRQSAQHLHLHVQQTPLAVIEWDHDFRICAWNPAAERIFGYSREEAMGRHYAFIVPESDRDAVDAVGEALMQQRGGARSTNRNTTRDGRTITCEWFSTPLVDPAGQTVGVASLVMDVTDREQAEAALRRSEQWHRAILHTAMDGIWRVDTHGRMLEVNEAYCRMSGYSEQELLGMHVRDVEAVEGADEVATRIERIIIAGTNRFESRHRRKDGSIYDVEVAVQHHPAEGGSLVAFLHDISERKRAEEALRQSEELLSLFMRHSPIQAYIKAVTPTESRFLMVSDSYKEAHGMSGVDVVGKTMKQVFPPEFAAGITADDWSVVSTGKVLKVDADLNGRNYTAIKFPIVQGDRALLAGYTIDITERKESEEALRAAKEAAETATQVKERFLANLSHELRTPLTPVLLAAAHWLTQPNLPAALRDDLVMVCRNLEMEARLLEDLLDVNRILYGKLAHRHEVFNVHEVISEALATVAAAVQNKRISVDVVLQADDDHVEGDSARVQQIIWNLLSNAIKFTPDSGNITISTANEPDGQIRVQVADSGMGIEPDLLSRLFTPFEQGGERINRQYGGMGLGLSICRSLAEAHGGSITATSDGIGKGSVFAVRLPLAPESAQIEPATVLPPAQSAPASGPLKILLVEDKESSINKLDNSFGISHNMSYANGSACSGEIGKDAAPSE